LIPQTVEGKLLARLCCTSQATQSQITKISASVIIAFQLIIIATTPALQTAAAPSYYYVAADKAIVDSHGGQSDTVVLAASNQSSASSSKSNVITLRGLFDNLDNPGRWNKLLQPALDELNKRHSDMNIQIEYTEYFYNETRNRILDNLSKGNSSVDIVSVDQIWLGDFAEKGLLANLTDNFERWGRGFNDLYETNLDGSVYNNTIYGLWLWTDIRGIWYWKDMLQEAEIDPESLNTWDGYISAEVKLKEALGDNVTQGIHLVSASHDPDLWYPYLWMLGGDILELREGHPTKGVYWFPSYNSTEGVQALHFLKRQMDAGIKPQATQAEKAFVNKNFAVMLAGSWMPGEFPKESWPELEEKVGFIPMFPVPNQTVQTTTLMGGWELAIPATSKNSDLAWELITLMAEPDILAPFLQEYGYLPTQKVLGDGPLSLPLKESVPFYEEMVSMIQYGRSRPNIPEYPSIAEHIHAAIQQVYNGSASPDQALNIAAAKSADSLGWQTHKN
jgi:multiple sugar transport system substrate-binding protein